MSNPETLRQIEDLVKSEHVVLFMKGTRSFPQCGFSAAVVQILNSLLPQYKTVNVLADPAVRQGIKDFSSWPTIPQLYIGGEFVGGSDIVRDLFATGELQKKLGVEVQAPEPPALTITEAAGAALKEALAQAGPDEHVHLGISPGFEHDLSLGPKRPGELEVASGGITLLVDPLAAERAQGLTIDHVNGPGGAGFKIDNPNAPPAVKDVSARELAALLEAGPLELFDVRPPDERALASIPGARPLDDEGLRHIESLDPDTPIYFHCKSGGRSMAAASRFVELGFRKVYNVTGGIDAWSRDVDPKVPRY